MDSHRSSNISRKLSILFNFLLLVLFAQTSFAADVKGTVANAQGGEPLAKVRVAIQGSNFLTTTGVDGSFTISQIPAGNYLLQVSAVGYRTLSIPFQFVTAEDRKEFQLTLTPDNLRRTDVVEVHGDVFEPHDFPAPGDMTLTSSELQQTSTVLANDPFRSIQTMPGVSASSNNDFFAQFSVMGAPFDQVGIYVDDVLVPTVIHSVSSFPDAPTLSLFTGGDVEDLRLMPVAYPVRYADGSGAALAISTRTGSDGPPLFHVSAGLAQSDFLAEGGLGHKHKGTWLIDARKSYIGYVVRRFANTDYSQDGFYDADAKFTYDLTPTQSFSFLATGGSLSIDDPGLSVAALPTILKNGTSDVLITRLGWRWTPSSNLLLDTHAAYVSTRFNESNAVNLLLRRRLDREWSGGTNLSWNWHSGSIFQAGYTVRRPDFSGADNFFANPGQPPIFSSFRATDTRQDAYFQESTPLWHDRIRLSGGFRWSRLSNLRVQPITGQFSMSYRVARDTQIEAAWGRYAQLPTFAGLGFEFTVSGQVVGAKPLPPTSSQYLIALEQRLGERTRFRIEAFDRQNEHRDDLFLVTFPIPPGPVTLLVRSALEGRDYSRGLQFILQRRSENRLSGWIGYTLTYAQFKTYLPALPPPVDLKGMSFPYTPTTEDQRHTMNLFGTYRLTPSVRLSVKALYGSGFPVTTFILSPIIRIGPYERLDLRADKSWSIRKFKLSLYGELLNVTNHDNRRFSAVGFIPPNKPVLFTNGGLPITPTAGLAFDF